MRIDLSKPLALDPLALLIAEEAALAKRLDAVKASRAEIEEQRKKDPVTEAPQVEAIDLDFDTLTGKDIEFCARQAERHKGQTVKVLVTDRDFHAQVAAKLSGVSVDTLLGLPAGDYVEVVTAVQGFLTRSL